MIMQEIKVVYDCYIGCNPGLCMRCGTDLIQIYTAQKRGKYDVYN